MAKKKKKNRKADRRAAEAAAPTPEAADPKTPAADPPGAGVPQAPDRTAPDFDPLLLENQLCFPLYAASRRIVSLFTPYFKPYGLTYTQYIVLLVLWEENGVPVRELGRRLYLDNGTLTPMLKKMETKGWITRSRAEQDERVVLVSLTDEGRALRGKIENIPSCVGGCVDLTDEEKQALYRICYKILNCCSEKRKEERHGTL